MKFQKLTAGLLALSMLSTPSAGVVQMLTAAAEETAPTSGTCGENVTWAFDESTGTLTISGTGAMYNYTPDGSYPWYFNSKKISSIIIENGVTRIGDAAFANSTSLPSVIIPDSVTSIGEHAFHCCTSLTAVTIPDSVTSIGDDAFSYCSNLIDITIPDGVTSIGRFAFSETQWLTAKQEENPLVIVNSILIDGTTCSGDVTIPDTVTSIEDDAFHNCDNLTSVTIPNSVRNIGFMAFFCCENLTDITILNPACEIDDVSHTISNGYDYDDGNYYFAGIIHGYANSTAQSYAEEHGYTFESLGDAPDTPDAPTSGTCGENVTWAFDESTGTLTISGTGAMENYNIMYDTSPPWNDFSDDIQTVIIEEGVTSIESYAFDWCTSLSNVTIPNSVTSIGYGAFAGTPWLTAKQEEDPLVVVNGILIDGTTSSGDITIPDGVTSIGNTAFNFCENLTSVTIPDSVTSIGNAAFANCTSLTEITIPDSVTSIGNAAFANCTSLTEITIPDSVTSIGAESFIGTPWLDAKQEENPFVVVNGILIDGRICTGDITIPDGVTSIGGFAFRYCGLTSVTIPDSVTSIWGSAFNGCAGLTSINIPDSVTSIEGMAFYDCNSLPSITIPNSVTSIGSCAFDYCRSLTDITILNPDCEIDDNVDNDCFTSTIHGYANSTAQAYAEKHGYTFESLGDAPDTPDAPTSGTCGENVTWAFDESTGTLTISGTGEMEDYDYKSPSPWGTNKSEISSVIIEDGVTGIGSRAFYFFDSLTGITIPDSVTSIGEYAFFACTSLTDITILNPECDIYDGSVTISNGRNEDDNAIFTGTIHGYANSTAQSYAEKYERKFEALGDAPEVPTLAVGNVNGDEMIDASDAADLLIALANIGAGQDSGLTAAQEKAADADGNGELDAGDAAIILQYAAYLGSGGTGTLADFLNQ